ncbi:MAG: adenylosuccinate lyase, partial [Actinomycetota bacterium]|nr:adenylosuccinate lyase [Actinomycetota bacterium]
MSARITDSAMYGHLWGSPAVRAVFEERGRLQSWLEVLAALARAQAAEGIVPSEAAEQITRLA